MTPRIQEEFYSETELENAKRKERAYRHKIKIVDRAADFTIGCSQRET